MGVSSGWLIISVMTHNVLYSPCQPCCFSSSFSNCRISLFQILTHSRVAAVFRLAWAVQTQVDMCKRTGGSSFCLHFAKEPSRKIKLRYLTAERSKYSPHPGSRACAMARVSSNTPSRLGLTRENRLCVNTDSDLDLRWEGEEERWMEIWKKKRGGGTEREGGVVQKERVGWFLWLGQQKGERRTGVGHLALEFRSGERIPGASHTY